MHHKAGNIVLDTQSFLGDDHLPPPTPCPPPFMYPVHPLPSPPLQDVKTKPVAAVNIRLFIDLLNSNSDH